MAPTVRAAEVDFSPVLSFGVLHSGNVLLVGYDPATGQPATPVSDDIAAVTVDLGVDRKTPGSTFSFHYMPTYVAYHQRSDLDFFGNTVTFSYANALSRRTGLTASLDATRSDAQGITASNADRPNTIVPRTTVTRVHAVVGGSEAVAQRGVVDWEVHGGLDRYDPVPNVSFNNSSWFGARGGWQYGVSQRGTLGLAVEVDRFAYDLTANVLGESLVLAGTYRLGRSTSMSYDVGATRSTSDGTSSTNANILVSFTRDLTDVSHLYAGASQSITPGTGLQASTRDSGAWVSYERSPRGRGLGGAVNGAYWYRQGLAIGGASTGKATTLNLDGSIGWTFNRYVSLNALYSYVDQTTSNVSTSALDTRYSSYGIFLRWAILGRWGSVPTGLPTQRDAGGPR